MPSSAPSLIFLGLLGLASIPLQAQAALQGSTCTPRQYTGSICKDFINYNTAGVLAGQARSELSVQGYIDTIKATGVNAIPVCFDKLQALACGLEYPQCTASGSTQVVCLSTCRDAIDTCAPLIRNAIPANGAALVDLLVSNLHNCTKLTTANAEPYAPAGQCLAPVKAASANGNNQLPLPLPSRTSSVANKNCNEGGCCVPCPVQDWVYPSGQFSTAVVLSRIASGISALLCGYVVLSWAVLPGRRQHPGDIVLHFAIAAMIWQACALFLLGNPKRIQCADDVTVSTASNNLLCGIQGALLMCSVHATVFWAGYMIANLHATIVWRSNIFERFKPLGVTLCWGLPGIFTFLPFLVSNVDAVTGLTCLIASKDANKLFFSVHAVIVIPSFFLNLGTMIHIMIVARRTSSNMSGGYSSNGYSGNGYSGDGKPVSARRQMLQLLKLNWRALFLGVIFIVTYVTYVIFYQVVVTPLANTDNNTVWDQGMDGMTISPVSPLIIVSACLVSSVGLWLFIIFGFNLQILYDWVNWFYDTCGAGRKSRAQAKYAQDEPEWR
ncbi:hypothetical protein BC829DRAFT_398005 [Chytridium lagenaria]|nr:hypothetical protein BC829DRAFT_398005 [Chytridium lagenaria]